MAKAKTSKRAPCKPCKAACSMPKKTVKKTVTKAAKPAKRTK